MVRGSCPTACYNDTRHLDSCILTYNKLSDKYHVPYNMLLDNCHVPYNTLLDNCHAPYNTLLDNGHVTKYAYGQLSRTI